jgi:hypothetical protein
MFTYVTRDPASVASRRTALSSRTPRHSDKARSGWIGAGTAAAMSGTPSSTSGTSAGSAASSSP